MQKVRPVWQRNRMVAGEEHRAESVAAAVRALPGRRGKVEDLCAGGRKWGAARPVTVRVTRTDGVNNGSD